METQNSSKLKEPTESLQKQYQNVCGINYTDQRDINAKNDMYEFVGLLRELSSKCNYVTEFGVRGVCSTWALLAGLPKRLYSYDIKACPVKNVYIIAKENGVEFRFFRVDLLDNSCDIMLTELLLVDTDHNYDHVLAMLFKYHEKALKYIAIHDTTMSDVRGAVEEFLSNFGDKWKVYYDKKDSEWGMIVLERISV